MYCMGDHPRAGDRGLPPVVSTGFIYDIGECMIGVNV